MKKATVDLFTRIFSVLAPPPNMTVSQWADKYRRLSSESSAEPGRWRTSKAPYQREIMDAVCDMRVQKVVIMSAAQIGKTDALILNPIGYYMHYDPSPITLERHRLFGALDNLDGENAIVIAGATVKIFLADLELFHIDYPHI